MKRKRYIDEQIAYAQQQAEAGTPIKEVTTNGRNADCIRGPIATDRAMQ